MKNDKRFVSNLYFFRKYEIEKIEFLFIFDFNENQEENIEIQKEKMREYFKNEKDNDLLMMIEVEDEESISLFFSKYNETLHNNFKKHQEIPLTSLYNVDFLKNNLRNTY